MAYKMLRRYFFSGFIVFHVGYLCATKRQVPIDDLVERAEIVAVVTITSSSVISKSTRDKNGEWSFERRRLTAAVKRALKGSVDDQIGFECDGLSFEKASNYIVFLNRGEDPVSGPMVCIDPPNRVVKATQENERQVQRIIEKHGPHNLGREHDR